MRELARIAVRSGIVSPEMAKEFQRWGYHLEEGEVPRFPPKTKEEFIEQIENALEAEEMVLIRETDLTVLNQYLSTQKVGKLVLLDDGNAAKFDITYGRMRTGEYIIAWRGHAISQLLTNGASFLLESDDTQVFFQDIRELFFGEMKSFILCTASKVKT